MKEFKYGYNDLRKILITIGVIAVVNYFTIYMIGHWDIIVTFLQSHSQAEMKATLSQLRSKTILNLVILALLTAVTATILSMSNAIFAIFDSVVYGLGIGFLMNVFSDILESFVFIGILKMVGITDNEKKLKNRFAGIDTLENTDFGIILGYMMPIMSVILVNYHVTETKLSWRKWLLYIAIGATPSSFVYALDDDAVVAGNPECIVVLLVIVTVVYLVVTYLKRGGKKKT